MHNIDLGVGDRDSTAAPDAHYNIEHDEGHSIAAWTGVVVVLIGFSVGAVAYWFADWTGIFVSVGIMLAGVLLWPILRLVGLGPKALRHRHTRGRT